MTRKKKFALNTICALLYQIVTIICGFILPKFIIPHFGSKVNGLVNSITQFLAVITFLESGVGAVIQSSLYKPLAEKDENQISKIIISSRRFFNIITFITIIYVIGLVISYYFIINSSFSFIYTASLILVLAFSFIAQHYLFISYRLLLNADQLSFIQISIHTICLILNCFFTIVLIKFNFSIHIVKLVSAIVFALQPIVIKLYVDKHYKLNLGLKLKEEPIKQKWNGFAQHISSVILGNTDTVVLTIFSTLENVSIYSVYYLVVHGIKQIMHSLMNGIQPLFGNMLAKKEHERLNKTIDTIEFINFNLVLFLYLMCAILIVPFVKIYTNNFNDANYIIPSFGYILTLAYAVLAIRTPYEMLIKAAGHYKETQISSFIESGLNIIISITFVFKFGLIGVAIGTLIAVSYRTLYLIHYLKKNIVFRKPYSFIKMCLESAIIIGTTIILTKRLELNSISYLSFIILAIKKGVLSILIISTINFFVNRKELKDAIELLKNKKKRRE